MDPDSFLVLCAKGPTDLNGTTLHVPSTVSSHILETIENLFFLFCRDVSLGTVTMHKKLLIVKPTMVL